jgi:integrase
MMIEASGVPHWYATLFITTQARNADKAPNTQLAMLAAVRIFIAWAETNGINFEERFAHQHFLTQTELESLRTFAQSHLGSTAHENPRGVRVSRNREGVRARSPRADARVSSGTHYNRITYIAKFIGWVAVQLVESDHRCVLDPILEQIQAMTRNLRSHRPPRRSSSRITARRGLDHPEQDHLLDAIKPASPLNPFGLLVRMRNEVIILLLYYLGIRRGELLAIKCSDFDFRTNTLVIPRRHGDPSDPRKDQPVAKTMDRRLALSPRVTGIISKYILTERRQLKVAKRHEFLIVVHQRGKFQGQPLSMKGLSKVFATFQRTSPTLSTHLTAHVLRHTANDNFSELMDEQQVPEAKEAKMRSYLMGWQEESGTSATYTRRHVEKKARQASLKMQEGWHISEASGKK